MICTWHRVNDIYVKFLKTVYAIANYILSFKFSKQMICNF
ncbi:hypothetical protein CLOSBL3_11620 [Clostridiaceae bacterium BL-3]|nr:hypothetical protein CLOSBL3_11620 [Clostridiaceae bacterium BL-3]